jgi:hypothetical protein
MGKDLSPNNTFHRTQDGWIESNIRAFIEQDVAKFVAEKLGIGNSHRMTTWLYDPTPPPDYPYTKSTSAYSILVQLYARSEQLATGETLHKRGRLEENRCRFRCDAIEDMHHLFVECKHYERWRKEATERLMKKTKIRLADKGLGETATKQSPLNS